MLIPPNRQSSAIMADSLLPKERKKQLTQEITLEPAGGGEMKGKWEEKRQIGRGLSGNQWKINMSSLFLQSKAAEQT